MLLFTVSMNYLLSISLIPVQDGSTALGETKTANIVEVLTKISVAANLARAATAANLARAATAAEQQRAAAVAVATAKNQVTVERQRAAMAAAEKKKIDDTATAEVSYHARNLFSSCFTFSATLIASI